MPPKMKRVREGRADTNPRVILRPFMADPSGQKRSHLSLEPPTAALFNKPEFSDLKLKVGQEYYYAHKVVLCAASEVFAKMLSDNWSEGKHNELVLHEEGECAKVFDRFLYFCYSGNITISETYVIPLFTLSDKYDVKPVYEECIKIIEQKLKVYVVDSSPNEEAGSSLCLVQGDPLKFASEPSSDDDSSSSDAFESDDSCHEHAVPSQPSSYIPQQAPMSPSKVSSSRTLRLIGSETFPISVVIKMVNMWHNARISTAALYNLEARLGNQISQDNYINWCGLQQQLVEQMLSDTNFCYSEFILFRAAKAWLEHAESRRTEQTISRVLSHVRYPLLQPQELYEVEKSDQVRSCPLICGLIQEAMRYQLFQGCCTEEDKSKWTGVQFQSRKPRPI